MTTTTLSINNQTPSDSGLPDFTLHVNPLESTAIYCDTNLQATFIQYLQPPTSTHVFDGSEQLYCRLTVQDNIAFYRKWFGSDLPIAEILVMFQLQHIAKKPIHKCTHSEFKRVQYAMYCLTDTSLYIFQEPIQGVDILTTNTFLNLIQQLQQAGKHVLLLMANLEHVILLGDSCYHLQNQGLHMLDKEQEQESVITSHPSTRETTEKIFKVPAKVDDKVILFDPTEIDYIESQDGKSSIMVNQESFALDSTLTEIEKQLEVYGFYRCHRSYIVNLQKVREIITWSKNTYSLKMNNKATSIVPLSRSKLQAIQEIFNLK